MEDKSWEAFCDTGSIFDYLNYKKQEKAGENDDLYQGIGNKGANNRGE